MGCTRNEIVKQAQAWVGLKESNGSHKKIIDIYNTISPLPRGYKMTYTAEWCAATISALAVACKATDIIPQECSCLRMIDKAKAMGIWVENDAHVPKPGDIMQYDWDDDGRGENTNNPDHVGIVEKITGNTITVIEGNYSNAVKRRTMLVNGRYIRGYIVPKYAEAATEDKPEAAAPADILPQLRKGDESKTVKAMQILLIGWGCSCGSYGADGDFGSATDSAVRKFQKDNGLEVDGICGPNTWHKLLGM
jgi:hypothetical protein